MKSSFFEYSSKKKMIKVINLEKSNKNMVKTFYEFPSNLKRLGETQQCCIRVHRYQKRNFYE